jgi:hypothetical protein
MGDVEEFLDAYDPDVKEIASKIREAIFGLASDLKEKVYGGWKTVGYSPSGGMKDAVFAIAPQRSWVNLVFFSGTLLDDPDKLLEGTGKKVRHVKVNSVDEAESENLRVLMESAVEIAR